MSPMLMYLSTTIPFILVPRILISVVTAQSKNIIISDIFLLPIYLNNLLVVLIGLFSFSFFS